MVDTAQHYVDDEPLTDPSEIEFMTIYKSLSSKNKREAQIILAIMIQNKK